MVAYLRELHDRGASDWIVQHAQAPADAEQLARRAGAVRHEPLFCTEVGLCSEPTSASGMLVGGMTSPVSLHGRSASGELGHRAHGAASRCRAQAISLRNGTRCLKNSLISGVAPAGSLWA